MPDIFTKAKRSDVMSRIRGRGNKDTELALLTLFRSSRISGWRRHCPLPGRPDFVFPKQKLAVFVDGCFWHKCPSHCKLPSGNRRFWTKKLSANARRDRKVNRILRTKGWRVTRIWEHSLKKQSTACIRRILRLLSRHQALTKSNL
ncbi:MAG: very short patch repair endonuclease [Verrucomicrobiae bacterium]|nr:very short patch repair endonuclease [Verrucomicrobiae bacterium]